MHTISIVDRLEMHLQAENRHDLDAIMTTYCTDPIVTINGQVFSGTEAVRFFHDRFGFGGRGAFSSVNVVERKRHALASIIILEQTLSGIHTGKWQGIAPTQRRFEIPVCTVYTFDEAPLLKSEDVYFDTTLILRQLGVEIIP